MPAHNGRFYEMAAVAPQKRQCDFGSFAPARSSVKPPLHKAASTLAASEETKARYYGNYLRHSPELYLAHTLRTLFPVRAEKSV